MILVTLLGLLAVILVAPDTKIGRFLHHHVVARPAAALARLTAGDFLRAATLILTITVMYWLLQDDGLRPLAMASSDAVAWIVTIDVSFYLEAATALLLIVSAVRRVIRAHYRNLPRRTGRRESHGRGTSSSRTLKGDNDNDEDSRRQAA